MTAKTRQERWTLGNGLTVLYRQDKDFPLAYATLLFRFGARDEQPKDAGLCSMTVDLLMQGTLRRNARQLASAMESVGASIGTQVHEDYSEAGFVVPAAEIDRALGVLTEVLREPSFPAPELVKEKAHVLASLASRRDAIFNRAYDALTDRLYGAHPYGRLVEGTEKTVRGFTRERIQAWHRTQVLPRKGILSIVGPFHPREMHQRLERSIGRWCPREPLGTPVAVRPLVPVLTTSQSEVVRAPFEQAYYMVGYQAPSATGESHMALKVLNTLLGGGMSSRLFVTLREQHSLAYEVSSFYPTRLDRSLWAIYLGLPVEKLPLAREKLDALLKDFCRKGPTVAEVLQAKAMIRGAFIMDQQSRRRQGWYQAFWEFMGRGPRYGEEFLRAVDGVTPKQLQGLLKALVDQPRVTVTVVPK